MVLGLLLAVVGLVLVLVGAWVAVRSAANLAAAFGWSEAFVGATVVAFGTSAPEFVVSGFAALNGSSGVALGNVVGSNITNIALVLGVAALISPIAVDRGIFRRDLPVLLAASLALVLVAANGVIGRIEGLLLFAALVAIVTAAYRLQEIPGQQAPAEATEIERLEERVPPRPVPSAVVEGALAAAGIAVLAGGAQLFVTGASSVAERAGISEFAIGATLVATGTSLPEVATSAVAAWRRLNDIAVANVIGSNVFNALGVIGVAALARPVALDLDVFRFEMPMLLGTTLVLVPLFGRRFRIGRLEGALLTLGYVAFTVITLARG